MDKAFLDKLNAYANEHVDDVVEVIYAVNDGLMKTHEFIGNVQDRVDDVFQAAIDGVWKVSEVIELYMLTTLLFPIQWLRPMARQRRYRM